MKKVEKGVFFVIFFALLLMISRSVYATDATDYSGIEPSIIIDGERLSMQDFGDRVIDCTISEITQNSTDTKAYGEVLFEYKNNFRQSKIVGDDEYVYYYDKDGNISEELHNGELKAKYEYINCFPVCCYIKNQRYYYEIYNGIIVGLLDEEGNRVVEYEYDELGSIINIQGNKDIGESNSVKYIGWIYDIETEDYYIPGGGYYDPSFGEIYGIKTHLDIKTLFGDKYEELRDKYGDTPTQRLSSNDIYYLTYAASQYYEYGISYNTQAYTGNTWYTNLSGGNMPYLLARIIYAENTNTSSLNGLNNYLKYNRQGVAWTAFNRMYEAQYRYNHNYSSLYFANSGSFPTVYSVLTYSGAYSSLQSNNAKSAKDTSNIAYQQAFWAASCYHVCSSFEQLDAIYPQPTGITSQCYIMGNLNSNSAPNTGWCRVVFPGESYNHSGSSNYSAFTYYSSISMFNVSFSYSSESLYIEGEYYGQ